MPNLPTHVLVSATLKNALTAGVFMTIVHRGDPDRGTLYVKVDDRQGSVKLYQQIFDGTRQGFVVHSEGDAVDAAIARTVDIDPDVWVIDVEDKEGRLWFDAALMTP
ncbi:MAG: DUF1491 family protein [Bdellovibrionales bacterium]